VTGQLDLHVALPLSGLQRHVGESFLVEIESDAHGGTVALPPRCVKGAGRDGSVATGFHVGNRACFDL
jgi:hypothetical protein